MNIVFDFGGVLFEWNPQRLVSEHFPASLPVSLSPSQWANMLVDHQDWRDFDGGDIDAQALSLRAASRLCVDAQVLQRFVEQIPHRLPLIDPTVALLRALFESDHRVFYLSNMPAAFAEVLELRCPWIANFEAGIFSGRVKLSKPDPAIYAAAELAFGLDPSDTLFLDDSPANVAAARARGWQAEKIDGAESTARALAKHAAWPSP